MVWQWARLESFADGKASQPAAPYLDDWTSRLASGVLTALEFEYFDGAGVSDFDFVFIYMIIYVYTYIIYMIYVFIMDHLRFHGRLTWR